MAHSFSIYGTKAEAGTSNLESEIDDSNQTLQGYNPGGGGGVLPYIRYIGMCRPKGYGF